MRSYIYVMTLVAALFAAGCGNDTSTTSNKANSNSNAANQTANAPAANDALAPVSKPPAATSNEAPTVGPVVNAYYDALKRKDATAARSVMSRDFLQSVEGDMKEENKTDLIAFLTEFDKLPESKMEVRNELISGNKATAEIRGGAYTSWTTVVFHNEGGAWKLSNEVPKGN